MSRRCCLYIPLASESKRWLTRLTWCCRKLSMRRRSRSNTSLRLGDNRSPMLSPRATRRSFTGSLDTRGTLPAWRLSGERSLGRRRLQTMASLRGVPRVCEQSSSVRDASDNLRQVANYPPRCLPYLEVATSGSWCFPADTFIASFADKPSDPRASRYPVAQPGSTRNIRTGPLTAEGVQLISRRAFR